MLWLPNLHSLTLTAGIHQVTGLALSWLLESVQVGNGEYHHIYHALWVDIMWLILHSELSRLSTKVTKDITVVLLNRTHHELCIEQESSRITRGQWMSSPDSMPAEKIRAGESSVWRCRAENVGTGISGSVLYRTAEHPPHGRVALSWKSRHFGPNEYLHYTSSGELNVKVIGGHGDHAVVVFIIGEFLLLGVHVVRLPIGNRAARS
jgi:hypothetical protein